MFILTSAYITHSVLNDPEITRAARGRQEIAAFMDDIKTHAPTKAVAEAINQKVENAAKEVGLQLNIQKCGIYNHNSNQEDDEDMPFLPRVPDGYNYLGLVQTERDTFSNIERVRLIVDERVDPVLLSKLSPAQKIHMLNTTVIPAILYVMGNVYLRESRASTLAKCKAIDTEIRKKLVLHKLHGRTTTKAIIYISKEFSGLGLLSIKNEAEVQYVRKGVYLEYHPDMTEVKARYERLANAGWRNPISDARAVLQDYELEIPLKTREESTCTKHFKVVKKSATTAASRYVDDIHALRTIGCGKSTSNSVPSIPKCSCGGLGTYSVSSCS